MKPIEFREIERLDGKRCEETLTLEFKRRWWKPPGAKVDSAEREAAKDVAAMMNASGGCIVIGVGEDEGESRRLTLQDAQLSHDPQQQLQRWLHRHLRPVAAASYASLRIEKVWVRRATGKESVTLAVVDVRPWPNGPVWVQNDSNGDSWRVPVREGAHTKCLTPEVAMTRFQESNRAVAIKLQDWFEGHEGVVFAGPVQVRIGQTAFPLHLPLDSPMGKLVRLGDDSCEIAVNGSHNTATAVQAVVEHLTRQKDVDPSLIADAGLPAIAFQLFNKSRQLVSLPYSLVRHIWCDVRKPTLIRLAIAGTWEYAEGNWFIHV